MGFSKRAEVFYKNKFLYHLTTFISFVLAIWLIPIISDFLMQYIQNELILQIISYIGAYIGAIYIIPEILFIVLDMMMDK